MNKFCGDDSNSALVNFDFSHFGSCVMSGVDFSRYFSQSFVELTPFSKLLAILEGLCFIDRKEVSNSKVIPDLTTKCINPTNFPHNE